MLLPKYAARASKTLGIIKPSLSTISKIPVADPLLI